MTPAEFMKEFRESLKADPRPPEKQLIQCAQILEMMVRTKRSRSVPHLVARARGLLREIEMMQERGLRTGERRE